MEELKMELTLGDKLKAHRKEIAFGVTGGVLLIGGILLCKKFGVGTIVNCTVENVTIQAEKPEITIMEDVLDKVINVFPVEGHIRKLPEGWKASETQILAALANDIILGENETWVNKHMRCLAS